MALKQTIETVDEVYGLLKAVQPELSTVACDIEIVAKHGRWFSDYAAVCKAHYWVSQTCGTQEQATSFECEMATELEVHRRRLLALLRDGFKPIDVAGPEPVLHRLLSELRENKS